MSDGYDTFTQGVFNQVNAIVDAKLGHEIGLVSFNSFTRNYQHVRYFLCTVPFCQQLKYISFSLGQLVIRVLTGLFDSGVLVIFH